MLVVCAQGLRVETAGGENLLDFATGGLLPMGHGRAEATETFARRGVSVVERGIEHRSRVVLMRKLAELFPGGMNRRVALCDSGREAIARAVSLCTEQTGRRRVRYLAAIARLRVEELRDAAAVVAHPFDSRLEQVAGLVSKSGAKLVVDETEVAPGTSGRMLAVQWSGVRPDVLVLGKGLAAGLPLGACVTGSSRLHWDSDGGGGVPAACEVALGYLLCLERGLLQEVAAAADYLRERLQCVLSGRASVRIAGAGLVLSLRFSDSSAAAGFRARCQEAGLLLARTASSSVGVRPAAVVTRAEVDEAANIIGAVLTREG